MMLQIILTGADFGVSWLFVENNALFGSRPVLSSNRTLFGAVSKIQMAPASSPSC